MAPRKIHKLSNQNYSFMQQFLSEQWYIVKDDEGNVDSKNKVSIDIIWETFQHFIHDHGYATSFCNKILLGKLLHQAGVEKIKRGPRKRQRFFYFPIKPVPGSKTEEIYKFQKSIEDLVGDFISPPAISSDNAAAEVSSHNEVAEPQPGPSGLQAQTKTKSSTKTEQKNGRIKANNNNLASEELRSRNKTKHPTPHKSLAVAGKKKFSPDHRKSWEIPFSNEELVISHCENTAAVTQIFVKTAHDETLHADNTNDLNSLDQLDEYSRAYQSCNGSKVTVFPNSCGNGDLAEFDNNGCQWSSQLNTCPTFHTIQQNNACYADAVILAGNYVSSIGTDYDVHFDPLYTASYDPSASSSTGPAVPTAGGGGANWEDLPYDSNFEDDKLVGALINWVSEDSNEPLDLTVNNLNEMQRNIS